MQGGASADKQASPAQSLMQRLALVADGDNARDSSEREDIEGVRPWNLAIHFGLGLAAGGVIAALALLGVLQLAPDHAAGLGNPSKRGAALGPWVIAPPQPSLAAAHKTHPGDTFDMVISRGERASAPFGLRLTGTDEVDVEVLLRNFPATALLSRGVRREDGTWAVRPADLPALHLSLSDGTPEAFEVRIDVVAPSHVAAASTVARVRLTDAPSDARSSVEATDTASEAMMRDHSSASTSLIDSPFQPHPMVASRHPGAADEDRAARPPAPLRAAAATAVEATAQVPQVAPQPRHWPEGASGLGALPRESGRQVWWKMPAPTWSPFQEPARRP